MLPAKNCMKVRMEVMTRQTANVFLRPYHSMGYATSVAPMIWPTRLPMPKATCQAAGIW